MNRSVLFVLLFGILLFIACAKVASPVGGEKDKTPPKVVLSEPANRSTYFNANRIEITFDEYFVLTELNEKLFVSPPMKTKPEAKVKGKKLVITISDTLLENTTYTIGFGDAVRDLNEGNPIKNFEFVFSTGAVVDSMRMSGSVVSAFSLEPQEGVLVMLYTQYNDSTPMKERPRYVSRTDAKGFFSVNNIAPVEYRMFALKDINNNYLFDLANEEIAFLPQGVTPGFELREFTDSVMKEVTISKKVHQVLDTIIVKDSLFGTPSDLVFSLFQEDRQRQFIAEKKRSEAGKISLIMNRGIDDKFTMDPINMSPVGDWFLMEKNKSEDTITFWIKDKEMYTKDTLIFALNYQTLDSTETWVMKSDTISFGFKFEEEQDGGIFDRNKDNESALKLFPNIDNSYYVDLNRKLWVNASQPLARLDDSRIVLSQFQDTSFAPILSVMTADPEHVRKYLFEYSHEENKQYKVLIPEGAMTSIFDETNDTITLKFTVRPMSYYANIKLSVKNVTQNLIVQLIDAQGAVSQQVSVQNDQKIVFNYLPATAKYKIRAIVDVNKNGKWDTGNYLQGVLPEVIIPFKGEIKLRSNWDTELDWKIK